MRAMARVKSFRDEPLDRLTHELLGGQAKQLVTGFSGELNNALFVHDNHGIRGELQQPLCDGANFGHFTANRRR